MTFIIGEKVEFYEIDGSHLELVSVSFITIGFNNV